MGPSLGGWEQERGSWVRGSMLEAHRKQARGANRAGQAVSPGAASTLCDGLVFSGLKGFSGSCLFASLASPLPLGNPATDFLICKSSYDPQEPQEIPQVAM